MKGSWLISIPPEEVLRRLSPQHEETLEYIHVPLGFDIFDPAESPLLPLRGQRVWVSVNEIHLNDRAQIAKVKIDLAIQRKFKSIKYPAENPSFIISRSRAQFTPKPEEESFTVQQLMPHQLLSGSIQFNQI
jgi:hypothetical protein